MRRQSMTFIAVVVAFVSTLSACGRSPEKATPSPTKAPSSAPAARDDARRSEPYWVPVTSFTGRGNVTTKTFTIESNAIQWKVSWRCQTAPFTVVAVDGSGKESTRKLAYGLNCPKEAVGFSADKGTQALKITTAGEWAIEIFQQVDVPLIEPLPAGMASATVLATAKIHKVDRDAEGTATVYTLSDGRRILRLEDFFVTRNADLEIRLSAATAPKTTDEIASAGFKVVAPLKATVGSMNYEIPKDLEISQFNSLVIWCEITRNAYAAGSLEPYNPSS